MATVVFQNAAFFINNVDFSGDASQVQLNYASEQLDETAMGDTTRIRKGGLKTWDVSVTFHQDFRAAGPDATLFPLVGSTVCFEVRAVNSCSTAINPIYSGIAILESWPAISGNVGALLDAQVKLNSAGNLSRASSS